MIIKLDPSTLKQTKWYEYLVRFLLGGLITAAAGLIAKVYGPVVGGLFLAFPPIFPCTATLIAKHEQEKKAKSGTDGTERGISAASVNAAGAVMGSVGLAAFAAVVWGLVAEHQPVVVLAGAALAWFVVGAMVWVAWRVRHRWRVCARQHGRRELGRG